MAGKPDTRELAHEAIGSARLTAFGVSNVAPAGAVAGGLDWARTEAART
jgi:hypothetical protein